MDQKEKNLGPKIRRWTEERLNLRQMVGVLLDIFPVIYGELDQRLDVKEGLQKLLKKPVPKRLNFLYCFGGMTFLLFVIQVVTGILLAIYYKPSAADAYTSVKFITNTVPLGWLIRQIHAWGANLMIITVLIHMGRVYFHGAFKNPRELNWMVGVVLLALTMGFGFTGYLLPWDQKSFWGTTIGTEVAGGVPLIGSYLLVLLRGSQNVTGDTLTRFYSVHVLILPWITAMFLAVHFAMIKRQGVAKPL
ncbi:MAG: cytochrome b N-terminal domain-containing protein [candidate division Zixibacteria bacterium]|jgi:quinol-cytochrome oxidoreductase complex cytochrome b subunit|nr:cytochrome b N-terminal domain-containing protein [candidate division Zixibacteria bacterium]